jgi:hypothetical protein
MFKMEEPKKKFPSIRVSMEARFRKETVNEEEADEKTTLLIKFD